MKRCPQCNRVETEDTLTFCRTDGTPLVRESGTVSEEAGTRKFSPSQDPDTSETRILPTGDSLNRPTAPTTVLDAHPVSGNTRELSKPKSHRGIVLVVAALAVAALAAAAFYSFRKDSTAIESVAVLPFENRSNDADAEYLSDGLAESLIYRLSQLPNLKVIPTSSVFRYRGKETDAVKIGKELGVQAVMTGRMAQRGENLSISVELVDVRNNKTLWGEQYERKMSELMATQREIASEISNKLRLKLSGEGEQKLAKSYTENPAAYQLYLKGRFHWNRSTSKDRQRAVEYYNQAIALDPNYALAYAGLAETFPFPLMGTFNDRSPKLREAALKALSLDENLPEARTALGRILAVYDWDFVGAEREFRRAVELNPNNANAHSRYGQFLSVLGRREESEAEHRRALEIEPLSLVINSSYGTSLMYAKRYDEAVAHLKRTLELDENSFGVYFQLALAYQAQGRYAESIEARAKAAEINGNQQEAARVRERFASRGWEGYLRAMIGDREADNLSFYYVATCHAALGEKEKAFEALNKSYENREIPLILLKVDPRLDPLRSDPRFVELVRKVGLPQ